MSIDSDLIRGHVDTIILKTLATGDKYGYEIIKEIEAKSNGTYELKQPTLYSCLKRLESQGFISAYWVNSDIGGRRHYYKLTELGRTEFNNNMNQWLSSRSIIDNLISNDLPAYEGKDYNLNTPTQQTQVSEQEQQPELQSSTIPSFNLPPQEENPYMQKDDQEKDTTDRESNVDLSIVSDYYKTDENQIDLFAKTEAKDDSCTQQETQEQTVESHTKNNNQEVAQENIQASEVLVNRNASSVSTKFSIKDYKKNSSNFFNNVKDLVVNETTEEQESEDFTTSSFANILDETIEDPTNTSLSDDDALHKTSNEYESNDDEEDDEIADRFKINYFSNDDRFSFGNDEEDEDDCDEDDDENDDEEFEDDDLEEHEQDNDHKNLNFGFSDSDETEQKYADYSSPEDENSAIQNLSYWNKGFTIKNNYNENFKYDYEEEPDLSDRRDLQIKPDYNEPAIRNENTDIVEYNSNDNNDYIIEDNKENLDSAELNDNYYEPYKNPTGETTNLFVDNKRSFVPQYTDNDSKQLLNTLSSYGSTSFTQHGISNQLSDGHASFDDLKDSLNTNGIKVTEYKRRPKEPVKEKNYLMINKIKMVTSWTSFIIVALLLSIVYLLSNSYNYVDFMMLSTALPGSFFFMLFVGLMLIVPASYTVNYCLNKTKKVKSKFSPKIAIIFSLLFFIQCLVIIYAINIPFGLYSFTQKDYNHYLWLLPAVCACYIPIHTLVYTALHKTKFFKV